MKDLSDIFLKISADKGSKYAKDVATKEVEEKLNKITDFISITLQAEFNRISTSSLGKINTYEIGKNIKNLIEEEINRAISLIEKGKSLNPNFEEYVTKVLKQLYLKINEDENTEKILVDVFEKNLFHDFGQITNHLSNLNLNIVDRLLKYLVLLNIQRRMNRREFINTRKKNI